MYCHSRPQEVENLQHFQDNELVQLRTQLADIDTEISAVEIEVANHTNMLSAARGLVAMRGGSVDYSTSNSRRESSRSRPKQRMWTQKDGQIIHHASEHPPEPSLSLAPCGIIYTDFHKRFEAPRQSFTGCSGKATILLVDSHNDCNNRLKWLPFLSSLERGKRLWIVYWLDRNSGQWRNFVRPPRAKGGWRVGLFATRSPNRPSPIGLSLSIIEDVDTELCRIIVSGVDILDETPLMSLKLYDEENEDYPDARSGWLDEVKKLQPLYYDPLSQEQSAVLYDISFEEAALSRLDFIDERSVVDVRYMVQESLKRIQVQLTNDHQNVEMDSEISACLPVGAFRVLYRVSRPDNRLCVSTVVSGMRKEVCSAEATTDPEARLHLEFQKIYDEDFEK